jgi:hypothetical protein
MSDGAKQQLIAEAKMQGAKTPEDYQALYTKKCFRCSRYG